jgi:hypothetical protein
VAAHSRYEDFHIDRVDFSKWRDFEHYTSSISNNIRRDLKKAKNTGAKVNIRHGWSALRDLYTLVKARRLVMEKNKMPFHLARDLLLHFVKIIYFGKQAFIATVSLNDVKYSALLCTVFGDRCYYIAGGVWPNDLGLGSYGMMSVIEHWQEKSPKGQFVMGYVRGQTNPENYSYTEGALLYRRKLRVTASRGCEFSINVKDAVASAAC